MSTRNGKYNERVIGASCSTANLLAMNTSKSKTKSPLRSPSVQKSKRKSTSTPDLITPSKRARARQNTASEENTALSVETLKSSRKSQKTKVLNAEGTLAVQGIEEASKKISKGAKSEVVEEEEDQPVTISPSKNRRKRKEREVKVEYKVEEPLVEPESIESPKRKRETKQALVEDEEEDGAIEEGTGKKVKRKRKTKEEKEAEAMPLAARTASLRMYIGAHVSSAKGSSWPCSW